MRIVHLATDHQVSKPAKPKKLTKAQEVLASSRRWQEIQKQRNYRAALKEFAAEIAEIRLREPNWLPSKK